MGIEGPGALISLGSLGSLQGERHTASPLPRTETEKGWKVGLRVTGQRNMQTGVCQAKGIFQGWMPHPYR